MTPVLHKLLPLVVSPLGLVVLLVSLSVILRRRGPALWAPRAAGMLSSCDRGPALGDARGRLPAQNN